MVSGFHKSDKFLYRWWGIRAVGKEEREISSPKNFSSKREPFFPFKLGRLAITTLRVGGEGIQLTVDGKPLATFAYRQVQA